MRVEALGWGLRSEDSAPTPATLPLVLDDAFGRFGDPDLSAVIPGYTENPVGMADLEANVAGLSFWDEYFPWGKTGAQDKEFNICDFVSEKWDENKNPNAPRGEKP